MSGGSEDNIIIDTDVSRSVVRLLPHHLRLVRFMKSDINLHMKELIRLLFYSDGYETFFSYTEIDDEISLILDENSLSQFPQGSYATSNQEWIAIEIYEGSEAINEIGYIRKYSEPLARHKLNIIYLSTFDTDIILVEEKNKQKALDCLIEAIKEEKCINSNKKSIPTPQSERKLPQFLSTDKMMYELEHNEDSVGLTPLPNALAILSLPRNIFTGYMHLFLNLFLFEDSIDQRFFSLTSYHEQNSIVLDREYLNMITSQISADKLKANEFSWNAIHVQEIPEGISSDVVSFASDILADNGVSIYYLSTMNDDYILVPTDLLENAVTSLETFSSSPKSLEQHCDPERL